MSNRHCDSERSGEGEEDGGCEDDAQGQFHGVLLFMRKCAQDERSLNLIFLVGGK
jgi:hypothetical protein